MQSRRLIWLGLIIGSVLGGLIPMLWGAGQFSLTSIFFSTVGGFLGIWLVYKIMGN